MPPRRQPVLRLLVLLATLTFVLRPDTRVHGQATAQERAASIQAAKERLRLIEESLRALGNGGSTPAPPAPHVLPQPTSEPNLPTFEPEPFPVPAPVSPPSPTPSPPPANPDETAVTPLDTGWERLRRIEQGLREVKQGIGALRKPSAPPPPPSSPPPPVIPQPPRASPTAPPTSPSSPPRARGNYFLFAAPSLVFGAEQDYPLATSGPAKLKTDPGLAVNLAFGRRFDAWSLGLELGYRRLPYDTFTLPASGILSTYAASGDSTSYSLSLHGARDFPVSPNLNLRTGASLGVADRRESFTLPGLATPFAADGARFYGSLLASLEVHLNPRCALLLGYRFTYLHALESFDSLPLHQAELGLNWDL